MEKTYLARGTFTAEQAETFARDNGWRPAVSSLENPEEVPNPETMDEFVCRVVAEKLVEWVTGPVALRAREAAAAHVDAAIAARVAQTRQAITVTVE